MMKFFNKIKKPIKEKDDKALASFDKATLDGAKRAREYFDREEKLRRREDRRRLFINFIGGFLAFVGVNGSFIILAHFSGLLRLMERIPWVGISIFLVSVVWIGYSILLVITFFWLLNRTGVSSWIDEWIESLDRWPASGSANAIKFKKFPRRERSALVKKIEKELDVISDKLMALEDEAYRNDDDDRLSDNADSINQIILGLWDMSSKFLKGDKSWMTFALELEEKHHDLESELAKTSKYHEKVQPLLKQASEITAKALYGIIGSYDRKEGKKL